MAAFSAHNYGNADDSWRELSASRFEPEPADYCSRSGAQTLKERIESYWRERGQDVMLSLHNVGFHPAIRAARYDVRSDMINGMPRGGAPAQSASSAPAHDESEDDDTWIAD